MALTFKALNIVKKIIRDMKIQNPNLGSINIGSLGYQELILSIRDVSELLELKICDDVHVRIDRYSTKLKQNKRIHSIPLKDFYQICRNAALQKKLNFDKLDLLAHDLQSETFWFDTDYIYKCLGCSHAAIDVISHYGTEIIHDLNMPIADSLRDKFDIAFDGGTMEHCFNPAQVLINMVNMTSRNGYVFHISPMTYTNHGFYNFNPCLFHEFYSANGFHTTLMSQGMIYGDTPIKPIPHTAEYPLPPKNSLLFFTARKEQEVVKIKYPIQGIYL